MTKSNPSSNTKTSNERNRENSSENRNSRYAWSCRAKPKHLGQGCCQI